MALSIHDALLLTLVIAAACAVIVGDFLAHRRRAPRQARDTDDAAAAAAAAATAARNAPPPQAPPPPVLPPAVLPQAGDVLVVDDSAVARAKLRRLLAGAGYSVQLASDGVEALALLGKGRYPLMITDLEMPNMDGIALIHECARQPQTAGMPIIAVSAHENLRARFNECRDVCGVHRKPWFDDVLLSHVGTLIGMRTPPAPPARAVEGRPGAVGRGLQESHG